MRVSGAPASNPSRLVGVDEPVALLPEPPRFVSRGGEKLAAALARFDAADANHDGTVTAEERRAQRETRQGDRGERRQRMQERRAGQSGQ